MRRVRVYKSTDTAAQSNVALTDAQVMDGVSRQE